MIEDDELNRLLVNPLPPGVRLHVIIGASLTTPAFQSNSTRSTVFHRGVTVPCDCIFWDRGNILYMDGSMGD